MSDDAQFYLQSLDDLDREFAAGDLDPVSYADLKERYTALAAAAFRAETPNPPEPVQGSDTEWGSDAPVGEDDDRRGRPAWVRGVALLIAGSLLAGGAGLAVAAAIGDRGPGDQASGSIDSSTPDLLARARVLAGQGEVLDAIKTYDKVIAADPANVEALAYRGWLLRLASLSTEGLRSIDRAIAADPDYPDAHFFRAMILLEDKKDAAASIPEFERFLASDPPADVADTVRQVLDRARAEAGRPAG